MSGGAKSATKPERQMLLCRTWDVYDRLIKLFPDKLHVCKLHDSKLPDCAGRKLVIFDAGDNLAQEASQHEPAEIVIIRSSIPDDILTPQQAIDWAVANRQPWQPSNTIESDGRGVAAAPEGGPVLHSNPAILAPSDPPRNLAPPTAEEILSIPSDTRFAALMSLNTAAEREAMGPEIMARWRRVTMAAEAVLGAVDSPIPQNAPPDEQEPDVGLSGPYDISEPPSYATDRPDGPETAPNGHDYAGFSEPSRIWVKGREPQDWPQPIDLLQTAVQQEIDLSVLPGRLADRHGDIARRTGCDAGISVVTDFAAMAVLCDYRYRAQPKANDWKFTQRACFFSLITGESASRKSASMEAALETVSQIGEDEEEKAFKGLKKYAMDKKMREAEVADYVRNNKKLAIKLDPPPDVDVPENGCFYTSDFTPEGLRKLLMHNPNGALIYTDEISTVLGSAGRYSKGNGEAADLGFITQLYDGGRKVFLRGGESGGIVKNWQASMAAGTTQKSLLDCLKNTDTGFLQRMLFCNPRNAVSGQDVAPDSASLAAHEKICRNLQAMRTPTVTVLKFSPEAVEIFREFEAQIDRMAASSLYMPAMQSCIGRWTGTCARIALLYTLCEHANNGTWATERDTISRENAKMAVDFLLQFQLNQLEYFWDRIIGGRANNADDLVQSICRWIIAHEKTSFKLRDLSIAQGYTWLSNKDRQVPAMRVMEDAGWLNPTGLQSKGRAGLSTEYDVNPKVHPMYAGERRDQIRAIRKARRDDLEAKRAAKLDLAALSSDPRPEPPLQ